jgi:hypothetical protein
VRVSYEVGDKNTVKRPFRADFMHLALILYHGVVIDPQVLDKADGPLATPSAELSIVICFSKQQATAAEVSPALFLCVDLPKSALFRTVDDLWPILRRRCLGGL